MSILADFNGTTDDPNLRAQIEAVRTIARNAAVNILQYKRGLKGYGSGVLIAPNMVLTAAHCILEKGVFEKMTYDIVSPSTGRTTTIDDAIIYEDHDLALLTLRAALPATPAEISDKPIEPAEPLISIDTRKSSIANGTSPSETPKFFGPEIGFHFGQNMCEIEEGQRIPITDTENQEIMVIYPEHLISKISTELLPYAIDIRSGNSGSAIYSAKTGKILSIASSTLSQENTETLEEFHPGLSYGCSLDVIKKIVQQAQLKLKHRQESNQQLLAMGRKIA